MDKEKNEIEEMEENSPVLEAPETEELLPAEEAAEAAVPEEPSGQEPSEAGEEETPAEEAQEPAPEEAAEEAPAENAGEEEVTEAAAEAPVGAEEPASAAQDGLDGIALVCELCDAVLAAVGKDGFHGGVRPDNITVSGKSVGLGGRLEHGVGEFTPQELEYMAPELFWDGLRSPTADVYSLGLVLYAVYNNGRMPFWPAEGDATPNLRASTLQKRMSRQEIPAPAGAGDELSAIILRALSFATEERWHDVEELRNALGDCQEQQPGPANLALLAAGMSARGVAPTRQTQQKKASRNIDSPFVEDMAEEPLPKVKVRRTNRRLAQIIVYAVLAVAIVALVLLLRRCTNIGDPATTPPPPVQVTVEPSEAVKVIDGNQSDSYTEPTPAPTPEPTPEPTPTPAVITYTAYQENVSWNEAAARCQELGGELAMPNNYAEFMEITAACDEAGLTYAWLGARRDESGNWVTTTGETATFFAWGDGEPSVRDTDGTAEDYFLLWNLGDRWSGNDSRENPLNGFWGAYAGRIGFVCKTVSYETAGETPAE